MSRLHPYRLLNAAVSRRPRQAMRALALTLALLLLPALAAGCGPLLAPAQTSGQAPAPVVVFEPAGTDDPNVFIEVEPFQAALLRAIQSRDEALLEQLMAENFVSGWWRGELGDLPRADALRELYSDQLSAEPRLEAVERSELPALMGGVNPLDLLGPRVAVVDAVFVTGWGPQGRDEALLYVARQPDNSLRWAGTLVIQGGITSLATGGVDLLANPPHGYQVYLPRGYEVRQPLAGEIVILAPPGTEGHRERAFITVEPAGGRTVEQIVDELKATALADVAGQPATVTSLDGAPAMVFERVPGQDLTRLLYVVHEDRLYQMRFVPQDENAGAAYNQMRMLYAVIVNTFQFIPVDSAEPAGLSGGKLVADPAVFIQLLQQGLAARDKAALQSLMGDPFTLAFWRSEGLQVSPAQAVEQVLNNYLPAGGAGPLLDAGHPVLARLFADAVTTGTGEALIPVHVSGWGAQGQDEAVLFIARRADGSLYWQGALTAQGGFGE